jgi:hypothetical protein
MNGEPQARRRPFSLSQGGPFYRLLVRLHLVGAKRRVRAGWIALFAWLPMMLGEAARAAFAPPVDRMFWDLSVHARLLVAIPMIFLGERLVDTASRSAIGSLYAGSFCEQERIDPIVDRGERLRDSPWVEAGLAAVALVGGQLALWQVTGATGMFHGGTAGPSRSFGQLWYVVIALPLMQFVMFRWLWHWVIWSFMLVRIAALPLRPIATHPDRACGLSCMARPVSGFGGYAFALGAVLAGSWGTQMLTAGVPLEAFIPGVVTFVIVMVVLAVAPLLPLCGHLYRTRRRGLTQYGDFANGYMRGFHQKWIEPGIAGEDALGAQDIQSLADIGNAFEVITHTRLFVFAMRQVLSVCLSALVPMVPLLLEKMTMEELLKRIVSAAIGGLPL